MKLLERFKTAREFQLPPLVTNERGEIRRVGFELEFAGLSVEETVTLVLDIFGGSRQQHDPFQQKVVATRYGDFTIELDSLFLKNKLYKEYLRKLGIELDELFSENSLEDFLAQAASIVVPHEVVTPPIPLPELAVIETLKEALYQHKAQGTSASLFYAFGLHLNPEVPDFTAATLLAYLRAFLLLYDWIVEVAEIDFTRQLSPYITPFPEEYVTVVLQPDYQPEITTFITDYLAHNPTRNRPLDLLPLFAMIDEELVRSQMVEKDLLRKRPTFHYRLPNCLIDEPSWTIAREWNLWVAVEWLAANPEKIAAMSADYLLTKDSLHELFWNEWPEKVEQWLS